MQQFEDHRGAQILIVPRSPGPLIDPEASLKPRAPDEVDEIIDEIFGPDPGGSPGWIDVALLVGGFALILWAQLGLRSTAVTVVGVIVAFLGSVLPVRSAWRRLKRWWARRRRAALSAKGVPLNVGIPVTRRLVDSYQALLQVAKLPGVPFGAEAVSAAQLAVFESASLLAGAVPSTAEEKAYVEKRIDAIERLRRALEEHHSAAEKAERDEQEAEPRLERQARYRAGTELDAMGESSLHELGDLTRLMGAGPHGSET